MSISNFGAAGVKPGVCTSTTRPSTPYTGQIIFETDTFALLFWNGSAWQGAVSAPAGTVNSYAGSTAPTGWLLCAGQNVSRTTYATLFGVIGTTYGTGDGSTTFTLPDLRGRTVAGVDNMGGSAAGRLTNTVLTASNTIGATGGAQTHTLTGAQSGTSVHGHGSTGSMSANANHSHTTTFNIDAVASSPYTIYQLQKIVTGGWNTTSPSTTTANVDHTHTVGNSTAANASEAHNNTQPTMVMNYIIKF